MQYLWAKLKLKIKLKKVNFKVKILFLKTLDPILKSTERFALEVLNDPKYDEFPQYIDKNEIQKVFDKYGYKLNPFNDATFSVGMNPPNVEGHFLAQNIPEIDSTIIDEPCDEKKVKNILEKDNEITHIGLSTYAIGLENAMKIIKQIQKDFPDKIIYLGGIGVLYSQLQKLIQKENVCFGCGINWLREKFKLPLLKQEEYKIPIIETYGTEFISYTTYFVSQIGCPNRCNFCITGKFVNHVSFCNEKRIIKFFERLKSSRDTDLFLYVCDPNAFFPESVWKKVFQYFIDNNKKDNYIYVICPVSLSHLKKFNLKQIQKKCAIKILIANFGIESALKGGYKKNFKITNKYIDELNNLGIITYHNFILGLPYHNKKNINLEIERNLQYNSAMFSINTLKPIPTTSLYELLKKENRLFGEDLPTEFLYQDGFFPFTHQHLGKGFDALKYAFKAYYKSEEKILNPFVKFAEILSKSPIINTSFKLKKIAKMFLKMSETNLISFKLRMSLDLIKKYESKLISVKNKLYI